MYSSWHHSGHCTWTHTIATPGDAPVSNFSCKWVIICSYQWCLTHFQQFRYLPSFTLLLQSRRTLLRDWWCISYINCAQGVLCTWKVRARLGLVMTCPCLGGWLLMSKSPPSSLPAALRDLVPLAHWYAVISPTGKPFWARSIAGCSRSAKDSYQIHKAQV